MGLDQFAFWLARLGLVEREVPGDAALRAYLLLGKGVHRAGLNLGDCFAYALAKQKCEDLLLARHRDAGLPVTIVRPTYSMSERFVISLFDHASANLFRALRDGRPVG